MAEGYADHLANLVLFVTSGPGATNVVTALTDAYMDWFFDMYWDKSQLI